MERCSPVEMRKNLEIVNQMKLAGIDFVAIPVCNSEEKTQYLEIMQNQLDKILAECEDEKN